MLTFGARMVEPRSFSPEMANRKNFATSSSTLMFHLAIPSPYPRYFFVLVVGCFIDLFCVWAVGMYGRTIFGQWAW